MTEASCPECGYLTTARQLEDHECPMCEFSYAAEWPTDWPVGSGRASANRPYADEVAQRSGTDDPVTCEPF